ncbi:trimethylamine methyltransferase family protein [Mesorhizobium sp.]|uniref:trimethylamine methyltransferase family protein n=1 Tax=Mesorhizobium sp. TaxID=1871066 RepID=UPI000FE5B6D8|nr:trimethylamine methyltransferase family protein [Mesorhizobium sp.]RWB66291.1 MAG: methyltransferase [Mesorhizobium sp.]
MSRRVASRGRRSLSEIKQLPFRNLRNPYPPLQVISSDEIEFIHNRSLDLLEDFGCNFHLDEARGLLKAAGAEVDLNSSRVRFERGLVEEKIKTVPRLFKLNARNSEHSLLVGEDNINFLMVASAPYTSDFDRGRINGSLETLIELIKLSQALNICHGCQGYPVEPIDVPVPIRHLEAGRAMVKYTDKVMSGYGLGRQRLADIHEINRIALGVTEEEFASKPYMVTMCNCNSPLQYDAHLTSGLIENAKRNQVSVISPFTLSGAMSPVTLAGTLVQQNAEALAGIVLSQIVRPGAPILYGAFASNVDMKSGAPAFGTPEYAKTTIACGQLARRYGFPYRSSAPSTSCAADVQGSYETAMSLWACILGHANFIKHTFGWQEGGLASCFEKVIMDAELAQGLAQFMVPIEINEANVGYEAIKAVGPGGHFFGSPHTLERYQTAFYSPMLSDWRNYEAWLEAGAKDASARANEIWKKLLADYEEPALDRAIAEELDAYVDRRIREGGAPYGE